VVTHQLQVERRTEKVRRPETDVLPLCHATNQSVLEEEERMSRIAVQRRGGAADVRTRSVPDHFRVARARGALHGCVEQASTCSLLLAAFQSSHRRRHSPRGHLHGTPVI